MPAKVLIVGAGVIGLSTALCLQNEIENIDITMVADLFDESTVSNVAAGIFRPDIFLCPDLETANRWYTDTWNHFSLLANEDNVDHALSGVRFVSGYFLFSSKPDQAMKEGNELLFKLVPDVRELTENEIGQFTCSKHFKYGYFLKTTVTDPRYYLKWLTRRFQQKNGKIFERKVESLTDDSFCKSYDVIVNCTGLSARDLVSDWKLVPIRGQTIRGKAPNVTEFWYGDGAYIIPGFDDTVTLGGIKTFDESKMLVCEFDRESIWRRCIQLLPNISQITETKDWVGLRPFRQPTRVEKEVIELGDNRIVRIVHNYGHGGNGYGLSWGTGKYAAKLVCQLLVEANLI